MCPFPSLPDVPDDPAPVPLAPLDMILRFSDGRHFSVHLAKEPCPLWSANYSWRWLISAILGGR